VNDAILASRKRESKYQKSLTQLGGAFSMVHQPPPKKVETPDIPLSEKS
jgi:hypothetical protein